MCCSCRYCSQRLRGLGADGLGFVSLASSVLGGKALTEESRPGLDLRLKVIWIEGGETAQADVEHGGNRHLLLLMIQILHYLKDPKLWDFGL